MAGVNLFKIDIQRIEALYEELEGFDCIGFEEINDNGMKYKFSLYTSLSQDKKPLGWNWIYREFGEDGELVDSSPIAILTIIKDDDMYAITFGHAYFKVDKYCDREFAFDFAKRINYDEIKTTTLLSPHSKRNKTISTFIDYTELEFDSGESYSKIKVKINAHKELFSPSIEIGTSIKFNLKNASLQAIVNLLKYIENTMENEIQNNIPLFLRIKDETKIQALETRLSNKVSSEIKNLNISELDIIGAIEVFNRNDGQFIVKFEGQEKEISTLTIEEIKLFCEENSIDFEKNLLNIKIVSIYNGETVRTDRIHNLIDYTDDEEKCLLSKGIWYQYNEDYLKYLDESITEIESVYNPEFDFDSDTYQTIIDQKFEEERNNPKYEGYSEQKIKKSLSDKYYKERIFNIIREKNGFINYDRKLTSSGDMKMEMMDLYRDETMFAVKIGSGSAKLCYAVDQSLTSVKMYKHGNLQEIPKIKKVALWFIFERKRNLKETEEGMPDLTELNMLSLKNKIDNWKKEVRLLGYTPIIYVNYMR